MDHEITKPDNGKYRTYGSGHGTDIFFTLEARTTVSPALIGPADSMGVGDFILTDKWQRVPVSRVEHGVPVRAWNLPGHQIALAHGLVNYECAVALAHLFVAQLVAPVFRSVHDVEVRLVKVELEYSFTTKELGVGEIINRSDAPWPGNAFKARETEPIPLSARDEKKDTDGLSK